MAELLIKAPSYTSATCYKAIAEITSLSSFNFGERFIVN